MKRALIYLYADEHLGWNENGRLNSRPSVEVDDFYDFVLTACRMMQSRVFWAELRTECPAASPTKPIMVQFLAIVCRCQCLDHVRTASSDDSRCLFRRFPRRTRTNQEKIKIKKE